MKRDYTMLGVGFISGNVVYSIAASTTTFGNVAVIVVSLLMIVGSRYGLFGKTG